MEKGEVVSKAYVLELSVTVSEADQKKSGDFTQPMGSTRSMHIRQEVSEATGGTT